MVTYSVLCLEMTKVVDENNNGIAVAITLGKYRTICICTYILQIKLT